jgi:flagellar basal body P-ring formation protein FlgA
MTMQRIIGILMTVALCANGTVAAQALAGDASQAAQLRLLAENYLRVHTVGLSGQVSYSIGAIDARTVLAPCAAPDVFLPAGARLWGPTSLGVRCVGDPPWTIYLTVHIRVMGEYAATARHLGQGQVLTAADITVRHGDLTQLPAGVINDAQAAVGKTLMAALAAGQPLRLDLLRAPLVVQQGQSVKLHASGSGFRIAGEGRSLSNAADGQIAQVRTSNGTTVSGVARAGGVVEITF